MTVKQRNRTGIRAAILVINLVQLGTMALSPIISSITVTFPGTSAQAAQFLMTFPGLFILVSSLLSASLTRRISKKNLTVFGIALMLVSAAGGLLFHQSLVILYVWAGMLGLGLGLWMPLTTAMASDHFTGDERASLLGQISSAQSIGAIILSVVGGLLASIVWHRVYLVYLLAVPGLILALMYLPQEQPGPQRSTGGVRAENRKSGKNRSLSELGIDSSVILFSVIQFFFSLPYNVAPGNFALLLSEKGIGNAGTAGLLSGLFLFGGILSGLYFGWLDRRIGRMTIPVGFLLLAAGLWGLGTARSLPAYMIFCVIGGMSLPLVLPQSSLGVVENKKPAQFAMATAVLMALGNLGAFSSPFNTVAAAFLTGRSDSATRLVFAAAFSLVLAAVTAVILKLRKA